MNYDEPIRILCVDDEKNVLKALERLFLDDEYEILTASSGNEGLDILQKISPIQVVISDYRMPGMNGVEFLKEVCQSWPDTVRIVLSGYADTAAVVGAINEGQIYKFIPKPWNDDELKVTIANALERYFLHKRNKELTYELKKKNEELQEINRNLEKLVEERTAEIMFKSKAMERAQNILDSLPVAVVGIDPEGIIVQANKRCAELLRLNVEPIGLNRKDTLPQNMNSFIDKILQNGQERKDRILLNDKSAFIKGVRMQYPDGQEGIVLVLCSEEEDD